MNTTQPQSPGSLHPVVLRPVEQMTDDEKRIAIAEACGFVWYRLPQRKDERSYRMLAHPLIHEYDGQIPEWLVRADGTERICNLEYMWREGLVPDYPKNANDMLEAVKLISNRGWRCVANSGTDGTWECFLTKSKDDRITPSEGDHYGAADTLTGALVEAFLRVIDAEARTQNERAETPRMIRDV